jgi:hypothetical protein
MSGADLGASDDDGPTSVYRLRQERPALDPRTDEALGAMRQDLRAEEGLRPARRAQEFMVLLSTVNCRISDRMIAPVQTSITPIRPCGRRR